MNRTRQHISSLAVIVLTFGILLSGCTEEANIPVSSPKGWDGNSTYWWDISADTTNAFRPLDSLEEMGVPGSYLLSITLDGNSATDMELAQRKFNQYVKESLIELFRNEPEIVDSLFDRFVIPKMQDVELLGDVQPLISEYQRRAYQTLSRHFRYPRSLTKLGEDIPIVIPDSLKEKEISGIVFTQVAINKEGIPIALKKLSGVHPILDRIAMRALTEMRWQPAYVLRGGKSRPIASWTRMKVRFGSQN